MILNQQKNDHSSVWWYEGITLRQDPLPEFDNLCTVIATWPKPSVEWLGEGGLDSVEEGHCLRDDTVEGQSTCLVIQVHSYSGGLRAWYCSLNTVMSERVFITAP